MFANPHPCVHYWKIVLGGHGFSICFSVLNYRKTKRDIGLRNDMKASIFRSTGETLMNKDSSRSHSIFTIFLEMITPSKKGKDQLRAGKLNLVDLAGSERQAKTGMVSQLTLLCLILSSFYLAAQSGRPTQLRRQSQRSFCLILSLSFVHCQL